MRRGRNNPANPLIYDKWHMTRGWKICKMMLIDKAKLIINLVQPLPESNWWIIRHVIDKSLNYM